MSLRQKHSQIVKNIARELGFMDCGISKADFLEKEAPRLEDWLKKDSHGEMAYMANHFDKRLDPRLLVPGAKSVISLSYNYYSSLKMEDPESPKLSTYAYGKDYHFVVKEKLREFIDRIQEEIGEVEGRAFVDSAPVLEKAWAAKSGIAWIGKNANAITKSKGSFYFLSELILDLDLEEDSAISDYCGTCTKCIDACPTDAIVEPYVVDGSKCISYFTIELKDQIPTEMSGKFDNWMFGCDVCQNVCPWNSFSQPHQEKAFNPHPDLLQMSKGDWEDISRDVFNEIFRKSAVKRTKYEGLQRNIKFLGQ